MSQFFSVQLFVFISTFYYKDKPMPSQYYNNILMNYFRKIRLGEESNFITSSREQLKRMCTVSIHIIKSISNVPPSQFWYFYQQMSLLYSFVLVFLCTNCITQSSLKSIFYQPFHPFHVSFLFYYILFRSPSNLKTTAKTRLSIGRLLFMSGAFQYFQLDQAGPR